MFCSVSIGWERFNHRLIHFTRVSPHLIKGVQLNKTRNQDETVSGTASIIGYTLAEHKKRALLEFYIVLFPWLCGAVQNVIELQIT